MPTWKSEYTGYVYDNRSAGDVITWGRITNRPVSPAPTTVEVRYENHGVGTLEVQSTGNYIQQGSAISPPLTGWVTAGTIAPNSSGTISVTIAGNEFVRVVITGTGDGELRLNFRKV